MVKLRIGTDCSGIEAPIQALLQLKINFKHVFSSEIDKYCIKSIKANYDPEIIFGDKEGPFPEGDITKRNINDVPDIDLYVCGFPCQPFSIAGDRKGFADKRGNVFFSCLEVIEVKQPKYFILENVKGLLNHDKGNTWNVILKSLIILEKYGYTVKWKVLNTKDYGIPQNRERIFIIGSKKEFEWPKKKKMKELKDYIDYKDNTYREIPNYGKQLLSIIPHDAIIINLAYRKHKHTNSNKYCSSITCNNMQWNLLISRYLNIKELLMLQGFNAKFKQIVSSTQLHKQIGNSMSVNVLKCILKNLL